MSVIRTEMGGAKREYFDEEDYLPYIALSKFADHLIGLYISGRTEELQTAFVEIEQLHLEGEPYVREAATIGCLEGLQNIMGNRGIDADVLIPFLGPEIGEVVGSVGQVLEWRDQVRWRD